jgi:hypothetical protein
VTQYDRRELLAELLRRRKAARSVELPRALFESLHPKQRAFVEDKSPSKTAVCSRRAGKTHGISTWLLDGANAKPGGLSVYIGLNKASCRRNSWSSFKKLDRIFKLGLKFGETDGQLQVSLRNGHVIWLAGCGDASEIDKFRGATDGFTRVVVDEAQAFGDFLQELVEDALEPALLDQNGLLALTGTPGPVCSGYFYAVSTGDGWRLDGQKVEQWPTHHWTVLDNPNIPHAGEWLARRRTLRGWTEEHPTYRREWLGEWVNDSGALVYPLTRNLNLLDNRTGESEWVYVLGVDLGASGATAFVVVATHPKSGKLFVVESEKRRGMLMQAIAARIEQYRSRFKLKTVVIDEGGLGRGYADQFRADGVACERAEKLSKRSAQDWLRGLCLAGAVKVDFTNARSLVDECSVLCWDEEAKEEDTRFENHCADAFLYAARALQPVYKPEEEAPKPGSPDWHVAQAAKERRWAQEQARKRAKQAGHRF